MLSHRLRKCYRFCGPAVPARSVTRRMLSETTGKEIEESLAGKVSTPSIVSKTLDLPRKGPDVFTWKPIWLLSALASSVALGAVVVKDDPKRARHAIDVVANGIQGLYQRCVDTCVAATVLLKSMRSVLTSANEEAKLGLKMRVAALLADLSGANTSRRRALVLAGNGAVVDWLLETVSDHSTPSVTQAEAARALSHLLKDPHTCDVVLARPHAILYMFKFIFSIRPKKKKGKAFHEGVEILKGKSMLIAAIMDIVTSSCEDSQRGTFRPRLPEFADTRDIAAALQVIDEGGIDFEDASDEDSDENDGSKGLRGIGIKVLGGTTVLGLSHLHDAYMSGIPVLLYPWSTGFPHFSYTQRALQNKTGRSQNHGDADVSVPVVSKEATTLNEQFEYRGLWDDLQSQHVAVPLASWALASWARNSSSNRSKILELDSDGHVLMTALMAPERSVKLHGALTAKYILQDRSLHLSHFVTDWTSCLLSMASQACKSGDIGLAHVLLSAFSLCIERSTDAHSVIREKGFHQMREITKLTKKDQNIQSLMAKTLELLSTEETLSLEESRSWAGILLYWVRGNHCDKTKSAATTILIHILQRHGPYVVSVSQAWLTLLLTDLIADSKVSFLTKNNAGTKEVKTTNKLQNEIVQYATQTATQLANAVVQRAERELGSIDKEESLLLDLLTQYPFSEIMKSKKKGSLSKFDAADSAFATLKGIKAITEVCKDNETLQKKIIDSGGLSLLRHLMLSDDYEKLTATEAYDASRLYEKQNKEVSSGNANASDSSVRLPPTAHIRKHAGRLLLNLSLHPEASKVIADDKDWCRWLNECADGQTCGAGDFKLRSYARATLLNLSSSKLKGSGKTSNMNTQQRMCPQYEDMIFLINPESSYFKNQTYCGGFDFSNEVPIDRNELHEDMACPPQPCESHESEIREDCTNSGVDGEASKRSKEDTFPSIDVVFVHGLRGGPFKTWRISEKGLSTTSSSKVSKLDQDLRNGGDFWPKKWLSVDLPQSRLLTVKYKTNLSQWSGATLPLEEVSSMLLRKLCAAGIGERPVVFVTHSMGGLVVKQMLFQAKEVNHFGLVNNTLGIVFYSCPHFGSKLADMPWKMGLVLRPAPSIGELRSGSPRLEELNRFIRQLHLKGCLQVLSFSETKVTPVMEGYRGWTFHMEVVPIESAYPGFGDLVVLDGSDHVSSCKPIDREDPAYTELLNFLKRLQRTGS